MFEALIVGAVAVWRLTHMYQEEVGPGAIFEKLRSKVWAMKDTDGGFREGFLCFKCQSVWHSVILGILYFVYQPLFWIIALPLAISAIAIFINQWVNKDYE